jgi:hypothetical protein
VRPKSVLRLALTVFKPGGVSLSRFRAGLCRWEQHATGSMFLQSATRTPQGSPLHRSFPVEIVRSRLALQNQVAL